jgi:hypothetical protein
MFSAGSATAALRSGHSTGASSSGPCSTGRSQARGCFSRWTPPCCGIATRIVVVSVLEHSSPASVQRFPSPCWRRPINSCWTSEPSPCSRIAVSPAIHGSAAPLGCQVRRLRLLLGYCRGLQNVQLWSKGRQNVNLLLANPAGIKIDEPWYLVTNAIPTLDLVWIYANRFCCAQLFCVKWFRTGSGA